MKIFDTNVFGTSDVTQSFAPLLRKRGQGVTKKILNVSSIGGSLALFSTFDLAISVNPAYVVSQTALNMMTKLTVDQLAQGNIITTTVSPGWVKTDMGSGHALLTPEESVSSALTHLGKLTAKYNGLFFNYDGTSLPW